MTTTSNCGDQSSGSRPEKETQARRGPESILRTTMNLRATNRYCGTGPTGGWIESTFAPIKTPRRRAVVVSSFQPDISCFSPEGTPWPANSMGGVIGTLHRIAN